MMLSFSPTVQNWLANRVSGFEGRLAQNIRRLSSGRRISTAADDTAGLAVSARFSARARSLGQARRNVLDGISIASTAEGALDNVAQIISRMRQLATRSASGHLSGANRSAIHEEFLSLRGQIDRIAQRTVFNGISLLDGSLATGTSSPAQPAVAVAQVAQTLVLDKSENITFADSGIFAGLSGNKRKVQLSQNDTQTDVINRINAKVGAYVTASVDGNGKLTITSATDGSSASFSVSSNRDAGPAQSGIGTSGIFVLGVDAASGGGLTLQVGADASSASRLKISIEAATAAALGLGSTSVATEAEASQALPMLDAAITAVSRERSNLGVGLRRLEVAASLSEAKRVSANAALSRLVDADIALETANAARLRISRNLHASVLSQANAQPSVVLRLLG